MKKVTHFVLYFAIGLFCHQTGMAGDHFKNSRPIERTAFQKIAMIASQVSMLAFKDSSRIEYSAPTPDEWHDTLNAVLVQGKGEKKEETVKILSYDQNSKQINRPPFLRDYKVLYRQELLSSRYYMGTHYHSKEVPCGWLFLLQDPDDDTQFYVVTTLTPATGLPDITTIFSSSVSKSKEFQNIQQNFVASHLSSRKQIKDGLFWISDILRKLHSPSENTNKPDKEAKVTYLFTGFCLGGAKAIVAGHDFMSHYEDLLEHAYYLKGKEVLKDSQAYIFTFSNLSPFKGKAAEDFDKDFGMRTFRWAFLDDPKANPLQWLGYTQVGFTYEADNDTFLETASSHLKKNSELRAVYGAREYYRRLLETKETGKKDSFGAHTLPYYGMALYLDKFYHEYTKYWATPQTPADHIKQGVLSRLIKDRDVKAEAAQNKNYNDYYKTRSYQIIALEEEGEGEAANLLYERTQEELQQLLSEGKRPRRASGFGEVSDTLEIEGLLKKAAKSIGLPVVEEKLPDLDEVD